MINLTSASNNRTIAIVRVTCYNLWENFSLKFKKKLCENLNLLRKLYQIFYIGKSWFLEELDIKLGNKIESHLCGIFFPTSFTNRLWCILRTFFRLMFHCLPMRYVTFNHVSNSNRVFIIFRIRIVLDFKYCFFAFIQSTN